MALPAEKALIHTPIAIDRSRGSANMWKISASVDGASVAPARPRSARLAISISALRENAARIDTRPNNAAPTNSNLRRPMRSPSVPMVTSDPATKKP